MLCIYQKIYITHSLYSWIVLWHFLHFFILSCIDIGILFPTFLEIFSFTGNIKIITLLAHTKKINLIYISNVIHCQFCYKYNLLTISAKENVSNGCDQYFYIWIKVSEKLKVDFLFFPILDGKAVTVYIFGFHLFSSCMLFYKTVFL